MRNIILGSYVGLAMLMIVGFIAVFVKMSAIQDAIEKCFHRAPEAQQEEHRTSKATEARSSRAGGTI